MNRGVLVGAAALVVAVLAGCSSGEAAAPTTVTQTVSTTVIDTVTTTKTTVVSTRIPVPTTIISTVTYDPVAASQSAAAAAASVAEAAAKLTGQQGYIAQAQAAGVTIKVDAAVEMCADLANGKTAWGAAKIMPQDNPFNNSSQNDASYTEDLAWRTLAVKNLCPDFQDELDGETQRRADIKAATDKRTQDIKDGHLAQDGSHLVGKDIQPGVWQTVRDTVKECYWEISDAQGDIIDNNFISIAPQFTITIGPDVTGFTNHGCEFQWIGT